MFFTVLDLMIFSSRQDWATKEAGLHRLLASRMLTCYRRAPNGRPCAGLVIVESQILKKYLLSVRRKDGPIHQLKTLISAVFEDIPTGHSLFGSFSFLVAGCRH